jgi:predicted O-methyltransferase YrrM
LLAAISKHTSPSRILEIGTAEGDFTAFLGTIFPNSIIETIDLPSTDPRFWNATTDLSAQSTSKVKLSEVNSRDEKLTKFTNIKFREMNSLGLTFQQDQNYDLIWVDGDHTYPVVAIDIANALRLLKVGGLLGFDDIYVTPQENYEWVGQESFETLTQFQNAGLIKFELILKKLFPEKNYSKKAIWNQLENYQLLDSIPSKIDISGQQITKVINTSFNTDMKDISESINWTSKIKICRIAFLIFSKTLM